MIPAPRRRAGLTQTEVLVAAALLVGGFFPLFRLLRGGRQVVRAGARDARLRAAALRLLDDAAADATAGRYRRLAAGAEVTTDAILDGGAAAFVGLLTVARAPDGMLTARARVDSPRFFFELEEVLDGPGAGGAP